MAVSAPFNFATRGTVHIYEIDEGGVENWGEVKQILIPLALQDNTTGISPEFGTSLSIDGDSLVIGVPYGVNFLTSIVSGVAVLYERDEGGIDNWGEVITFIPLPPLDVTETRFGEAVSIQGDSIAVGFPGDDLLGAVSLDRGSAYIFDRDFNGAGTWGGGNPRVILTAPTPAAGDNFGLAVSMKENSVLVGASGVGNGSVFRHDRDQGGIDNWGLAETFAPSDGVDGDSFGSSIARQGGTVLIGAPSADDSAGSNSGGVYVLDALTGPILERTKISGNNLSDSNTGFGKVVAIDDTTVAIGARTDADTGAVYVFYQDQGGPGNWGQIARLVGGDSLNGDEFGFDLDLDGDLLAVSALTDLEGSFPNTTLGSVYIFERDFGGVADSWGQVKKVVYSDTTLGGLFGQSVSISNDTMVVSRKSDSSLATSHGSAYVYQQDFGGTDNWGEVKKLLSSDFNDFDNLGESVAIDGDTIAIGAPYEDQLNDTGAVYVFYRNQGGTDNWGEVKRILPSDGAINDFFGFDLAIKGDELLVGAPGNGAGSAYIYQRNSGGTDAWGEIAILESHLVASAGSFGSAVDLDADLAIVGDPESLQGGGIFTVFSRNRDGIDAWGPLSTGSFLDMKTPPDANIGTDVAILGRTILLGSSGGSLDLYDTSGIALLRNLALPPQVVNINTDLDSGDGVLNEGEQLGVAVSGMSIEFDQSIVTFLADSPNNIRLVDHGADEVFDSATLCQSGMVPGGDDIQIIESNIVYDVATFITTFDIPGPLTSAAYTLIVCPGIESTDGFQLDGNGDSIEGDAFTISFGILDTDGDNDPDFSDPDDDGDGMNDVFENTNGLDSLDAGDAGLDPDGDGLTNLEEFNISKLLDPNDPDTDGDGIDDGLDTEPLISNNNCTGGTMSGTQFVDATFMDTVTTNISCGAMVSITVDPTDVQNQGILRLIAPKVVFESGFTVEDGGHLHVISQDSCSNCGGP